MKTIQEQYNTAIRVTRVSPRQERLFASVKDILACDTETTSLIFNYPSILHVEGREDITVHNPYPFGISLAFHYHQRVVLVWARMDTPLFKATTTLLATDVTKTWHNARYDLRVCKEAGIKVGGQQHCTLTMARIYWDRRKRHSLQALSEFIFPERSDWEVAVDRELTKLRTRSTRAGNPPGYITYSHLPDAFIGPYSMTDVFMSLMLYDRLRTIMVSDFPELYNREIKVMYVIGKVESHGLAFDSSRAKRKSRQLSKKMKKSLNKMEDVAGLDFNPNSWQQVLAALRQLGIRDGQLMEKGKVTTGADKLREVLANGKSNRRILDFIEHLLLYRAYGKTVGTYLIPLADYADHNDGIVYTSINPADTRTGRMASRDPNLQNIPTLNPRRGRTSGGENPVRSCFVCRKGFTNYYFDYKNMEMVFFGLCANEPLILETYIAGGDVHGVMAEKLYGVGYSQQQRDRTKDTNFGIIYGMGVGGMAKARGVSMGEAKEFLKMYHKTFPSINNFLNECKWELRQNGYVEDFFGKRYHVPLNQAYKAINCIVQGGCASAFKIGLLKVDEYIIPEIGYILLPVHDELEIEKRNDVYEKIFCRKVIKGMIDVPELLDRGLTLRVDVSKTVTNWAEKKKLEI